MMPTAFHWAVRDPGRLDQAVSEVVHLTLAGGASYLYRNPLVGGAAHLYLHHSGGGGPIFGLDGNESAPWGLGASSRITPTSTILSKRRQGRASAELGKHGGPRRESRRGGRARRKECPKGHYWSYKEKKCVKSKFR